MRRAALGAAFFAMVTSASPALRAAPRAPRLARQGGGALPPLPPASTPSQTAPPEDAPAPTTPAPPLAPAPQPPTTATPPTTPAPAQPVQSCSTNSQCGCACAARCCSKACGCNEQPKVALSVVGLRASLTKVAAGPTKDTAFGAQLAGQVDSYALDGTTHGAMYFALGGGEAGFDGALAGIIDVGYRLDVAPTHGPFGRIGLDGRIQGNDLLFFSMLEIPRVTLGWQYLEGKTVIEGGLRGGPIITGRYKMGDEGRRSLSRSLEWGGFLSFQHDFLRFDASFMRVEAKSTLNGDAVDIARAALCGVGSKFGVCADMMLFRGDANMGPRRGNLQEAVSTSIGLTVGVVGW